ncbi:MAG: hypothetical protein KC501_02825 [Myxococcales bacterium]|nr:hypothetical protein [Myxococcales bacterium]
MRPWIALLPVLLTLGSGCQRLPGDEDDGADGGPGPMTNATTLIPPSTDGNDEDAADATGNGMAACDPVTQSNCEMDEKCTALVTGGAVTYACVADPGGLNPSSPCTPSHEDGIDGCSAGYACLADEAENGLCAPLCESSTDCAQGVCIPAPESAIPYCADDCSPFGSVCPSPLACRRNDDRFSCRFVGIDDIGGVGSPCVQTDDGGCASGLVCLPGALVPDCASDNCCVSVCDLSEADPCVAPSTCNPVIEGPAPGFEDIGACFVPA